MLNPDRYFDPAPAVRDLARELYGRAARLPARLPARPRRSAHARREHAVPGSGGAARHPGSLRDADALLAGRAARGAGRALARRHAGRDRPAADLAALRRALAPVPRHAERLLAAARARPTSSASTSRSPPATPTPSTTASTRSCAPTRSGRARCSSGSGSRCSARPTRPPTRSTWHQQIRDSGWSGVVRPTFRPDLAINILHPDWPAEIDRLGGADRAQHRRLPDLHRRPRGAARVLQRHGRRRHRPRGADAVHGAPVRPRRGGDLRPRPRRRGDARRSRAPSPGTC